MSQKRLPRVGVPYFARHLSLENPQTDTPDPTNKTQGWRPDSYLIPLPGDAIPCYAAPREHETQSGSFLNSAIQNEVAARVPLCTLVALPQVPVASSLFEWAAASCSESR